MRHKRTRFRRPQTNGKSERYKTLLDEWAYVRPYESNIERLLALPDFVDHYNNHRPHSPLKELTPMAALVNNVSGITPSSRKAPTQRGFPAPWIRSRQRRR